MLGESQQNEDISDEVLQGKVADVVYRLALESIPGNGFYVTQTKLQLSHLMRLWHFSSSVNSFFKHACASIQWG